MWDQSFVEPFSFSLLTNSVRMLMILPQTHTGARAHTHNHTEETQSGRNTEETERNRDRGTHRSAMPLHSAYHCFSSTGSERIVLTMCAPSERASERESARERGREKERETEAW